MTMDQKGEKSRLSWSNLGGKRPPFEALLSPKSEKSQNAEDFRSTNHDEFLDFDPSAYQERISSSDLYHKIQPRNGRKRTPLPLKESTEEWERRKRKK